MGKYTVQSGVWADENIVQQLRDLWKDGYSCSVIARALGHGITRNSVIGKATRLGLPARGNGSMSRRSYGPTPPKPKPVIVRADPTAPQFLCGPNTFPEGNACRFIQGDIGGSWQMCGQPGFPWCTFHRSVAYDAIRTAAANKKAEQRRKGNRQHWAAA